MKRVQRKWRNINIRELCIVAINDALEEQIYVLCVNDIKESCAQATDRRLYRKVCKDIKQLIQWKGKDYARELITELKQTYPRKPALIDELEKVESKL